MGLLKPRRKRAKRRRPDIYRSHAFKAERVRKHGKRGRTVHGRVSWTLAGKWTPAKAANHVAKWDHVGYKIGLRIKKTQTVTLSYRPKEGGRSIALREDRKVTAELRRNFSAGPGLKWVGFVPAQPGQRREHEFEHPNHIHFFLELRISPADARHQIIPYVGRHPNASFRDGHISGSWSVPARGK
jgi:hypothetical protein